MTYLPDLHSYLHQSSLLIQAYPTTRVTTKYSLPRRPHGNPNSKRTQKAAAAAAAPAHISSTTTAGGKEPRERRDPAATLTLKTFHADSGICLKYRTDKAQEVGRLLTGLGRLANGEIIEMPSSTSGTVGQTGSQMEVDGEQLAVPPVGTEGVLKDGKAAGPIAKSAAEMTQPAQQQPSSGGGGKKKKKGGKK